MSQALKALGIEKAHQAVGKVLVLKGHSEERAFLVTGSSQNKFGQIQFFVYSQFDSEPDEDASKIEYICYLSGEKYAPGWYPFTTNEENPYWPESDAEIYYDEAELA